MKESLAMERVRPVLPVAPWVGGKRVLARHVIERIGAVPHSLYAEPFVGMGGVFFRRAMRPPAEAINDLNRDAVTLFRLLQRHFQQLCDVLKWQVCSRADFERLLSTDPATLTDLERAARFLYLQRTTFGGKVVKQSFGVSRTNPARFDLTKLVPMLEAVHERLSPVVIECLPYAAFIDTYDSPGTLFYVDPPYLGTEHYYGAGCFSCDDFVRLRDQLAGCKGRFVMSINDHPVIRDLFAGYLIEEVALNYRVSGSVTPARELIISSR